MKRILVRVIGLTLCLGGLVGGVAVMVNFTGRMRYPATASQGDIWDTPADDGQLSVWVYTPIVAPGDRVAAKVGVYGGLRTAIESLDTTLGTQKVHLDGNGKSWDNQITTRKDIGELSRGSDTLEFEILVPEDAVPGDVLPLRCQVAYVLAASPFLFSQSFTDEQKQASIELPIAIRSRGGALLMRAFNAAKALMVFLLAFLLLRWVWARMEHLQSPEDDSAGRLVGAVGLIWATAYVYAGYLFFALPLLSAIGYTADWFCIVLVVLWVVGPIALIQGLSQNMPDEENSHQEP